MKKTEDIKSEISELEKAISSHETMSMCIPEEWTIKLSVLKRWQADRQKMKAEINSISNSLIESEILRKKQKSRIDALNKERLTIAKNCISCRNEYKKALAESQDTVKAKE